MAAKKTGNKRGKSNLRSIKDLDEERALAAQSAADPGDGAGDEEDDDQDPPDDLHLEAEAEKPKRKRKPSSEVREELAAEAKHNIMRTLDALGSGRGLGEIGKQFQVLIATIKERAKIVGEANGTLTITLSCEANEEGEVDVSGRGKITLPDRRIGKTVFYASDDGMLSDEDPKQPPLPGFGPATTRGRTYHTDGRGNVLGSSPDHN